MLHKDQFLNGVIVEHEWAWCIARLSWDGTFWFPLISTVAGTRRGAIREFESHGFEGEYKRMRRRGQVKALRCRVEPCTFVSTHPEGAR